MGLGDPCGQGAAIGHGIADSHLNLAVEVTLVPNRVLEKQDCVAVLEVHVLAYFNPALGHVSTISAPLEKFPKHKKSHT